MITGVVKWFNNAKGYGFVKPDNRDEDVFVHFSSIEMDGYKTLKEGQKVAFEISEGPKGLHAAKVQRAPGEDAGHETSAESGAAREDDA